MRLLQRCRSNQLGSGVLGVLPGRVEADGHMIGRARGSVERLGPVLLALLFASSCTFMIYPEIDLRDVMAAGEWEYVLDLLALYEGEGDPLLDALLRGHVLHYAGDFISSNAALDDARTVASPRRTAAGLEDRSASEGEGSVPGYRAEAIELGMLPFYRAFNFVSLGSWNQARFAAQQAPLNVADAADAMRQEIRRPSDLKTAGLLGQSGFLYWVSGLLFEAGGAGVEAFLAYRDAAHAMLETRGLTGVTPPTELGRDLERAALRYGFRAEVAELRAAAPELFPIPRPEPARGGEVVFVLETGWIATPDRAVMTVPILDRDREFETPDEWARELVERAQAGWQRDPEADVEARLAVAVPMASPAIRGEVAAVRLEAAGREAVSKTVEDLSKRAEAAFGIERNLALYEAFVEALETVVEARAGQAVEGAWVKEVDLGGVLGDAADLRSWWTLPDRLSVARLRLPEGRRELLVEYLDPNGDVVFSEIELVEVSDGGWAFLNRRTF